MFCDDDSYDSFEDCMGMKREDMFRGHPICSSCGRHTFPGCLYDGICEPCEDQRELEMMNEPSSDDDDASEDEATPLTLAKLREGTTKKMQKQTNKITTRPIKEKEPADPMHLRPILEIAREKGWGKEIGIGWDRLDKEEERLKQNRKQPAESDDDDDDDDDIPLAKLASKTKKKASPMTSPTAKMTVAKVTPNSKPPSVVRVPQKKTFKPIKNPYAKKKNISAKANVASTKSKQAKATTHSQNPFTFFFFLHEGKTIIF